MNLYSNGRLKGAILLGLASVLWMFGPKAPLDRYFPAEPQNLTGSEDVQSHSTRELTSNFTDLTAPTPRDVDQSTSQVIRKCLPELDPSFLTQSFSLRDLVSHLRSTRTSTTRIELQNLHLTTSEGRHLRLMISPSDSPEYDGLEAKLFSVDAEGLPIIEQLPLSIEPRNTEAAKDHFLNLGTLTFSETAFVYKDEYNKIAGKLSYNFDELTGAELSQNGRFLGCSKSISTKSIVCKCL